MAPNPNPTTPEESLDRLISWAGEHADERGSYLADVYTHLIELRIRRTNDWEADKDITLTANPDGSATDPNGPDVDVYIGGQSVDSSLLRGYSPDGRFGEGARPIHLDPADDDLYEPGRFECGNCDFSMGVSVIIHGMDGVERAGVIPREMLDNPPPCPRCHEPMHRVSWRKKAEFYKRCLANAQEDIAALQADLGNWRENAVGSRTLLDRLNAEIDRAEDRVGHIRDDHDRACQTIAAMHKAALGETRGPLRGVVEDVQDLADLVDGFAEYVTDGAAPLHVGANLMSEYKRLHPMSRGTRRGSGAERARERGVGLALADDQLHRGNVGAVVLYPEEPLK